MIELEERAKGYYVATGYLPRGTRYRVTLTLIDPSGDKDERLFIWLLEEDVEFRVALKMFIERINAEPHWIARVSDNEIQIGPDEPYPYDVKVERI